MSTFRGFILVGGADDSFVAVAKNAPHCALVYLSREAIDRQLIDNPPRSNVRLRAVPVEVRKLEPHELQPDPYDGDPADGFIGAP